MPARDAPVPIFAHTASPALAQGHHQWWRRWRDRVAESGSELREPDGEELDPCLELGVTHVMESLGGVRVGGRLIEPDDGAAAGGVIVLHGSDDTGPIKEGSAWKAGGVTTLRLRVRGFPGSTFDTGPLWSAPGGWVTQGLEDPETSVLIGAIADVVLAVRALKDHLGGAPVCVRGDSLGGGLAVLAAANALPGARVERLAIGFPSLGDWTARLLSPSASGTGADAAAVLRGGGETRDACRRTLRLADAVAHARRVACPALCLLAADDPVVPPPAAAAVFNALGSDPGHKRRVITARGHQELGPDDLREYAAFDRLAARFLMPQNDALAVLCEGESD